MTPVESQLTEANQQYRNGEFAEAAKMYSDILSMSADNATALDRLGAISLWNNNAREAVQYLQKALSVSHLQKLWPFNVSLQMRLATAYYRIDRFAEAAIHYNKAAGPIAFGSLRSLKSLGIWLGSFADSSPYLIDGPSDTQLDFIVTDPLPVVRVTVGNDKPRCFLIDTGASEIILDKQVAASAGVKVLAAIEGQFAGAQTADVGLGRLGSIELGGFTVRNLPVQVLDLRPLSELYENLGIKGIIGTRLLMHFLSTIDYRSGKLVLRRDSPENRKWLSAQISRGQTRTIPFWLLETHYIVAWGTVNKKGPWLFFVDTGLAGISFTPMASVIQAAGISVNWAKAEEGVGGAGKVRVANIKIDQLTLGTGADRLVQTDASGSVQEQSPIGECQLGVCLGGLISHNFFP